ncbi:methionine synthase [soil metagenome]
MISPPFAAGLTTGVGSLPHTDAGSAIAFVLAHDRGLPAAPTLPNRSPLEGMVAQAAWGVPGVTIGPGGSLTIDRSRMDPAAPVADPELAGEPFLTLRAFFGAVADRPGPIKVQLTGPVTLGLVLHRAGAPLDLAMAVAGAAVRARCRSLLARLDRIDQRTPLVVLDEPVLCTEVPLATDDVIDAISGALAAIEPHAVTGLHCCGPADWRALLEAGPQVLSLPVDAGTTTAAGALCAFIEQGGWVAWGTVPTDRPVGSDVGPLWRRLSAQWCDLVAAGCDPVQVRAQAIITPACGLAGHGLSQAERVMELTSRLAARMDSQATGVRLSVGA